MNSLKLSCLLWTFQTFCLYHFFFIFFYSRFFFSFDFDVFNGGFHGTLACFWFDWIFVFLLFIVISFPTSPTVPFDIRKMTRHHLFYSPTPFFFPLCSHMQTFFFFYPRARSVTVTPACGVLHCLCTIHTMKDISGSHFKKRRHVKKEHEVKETWKTPQPCATCSQLTKCSASCTEISLRSSSEWPGSHCTTVGMIGQKEARGSKTNTQFVSFLTSVVLLLFLTDFIVLSKSQPDYCCTIKNKQNKNKTTTLTICSGKSIYFDERT